MTKNYHFVGNCFFLQGITLIKILLWCAILPWLWRHMYMISFINKYTHKTFFYRKLISFKIEDHHHHHVMPPAWISLILFRHYSQSFITSGRSSGLHSISSHSCCMYVQAGRPAFAWLYAGVHKSTSLMSSSLLLQQCPVCLVHLTWIVFVMAI